MIMNVKHAPIFGDLADAQIHSTVARARKSRRDYIDSSVRTFAHRLSLHIRPVQPLDKQRLANGFERLSATSRYHRFFGWKNQLTAGELRYLTEVDGSNHFAIGAFETGTNKDDGDAVGIARFIRISNDGDTAELSVAVVDDRQGVGIGHTLLKQLLMAARERDIKYLQAYVLAENNRMVKLVSSVLGSGAYKREDSVLIGEFPITAANSLTA
jgi:ribosomal protein S18 acetylase RimI-like enzyme